MQAMMSSVLVAGHAALAPARIPNSALCNPRSATSRSLLATDYLAQPQMSRNQGDEAPPYGETRMTKPE